MSPEAERLTARAASPLLAPAGVCLSVVIPVYRAASTLPELHRRIAAALEPLRSSFEVVFVEDCGGDDSWRVIQQLADSDARVRWLKLARNYGRHNALLCGIRAARGELIATIDDDLQNPPEEIPRLIARLDDDVDVVYGTPKRETHGFLRTRPPASPRSRSRGHGRRNGAAHQRIRTLRGRLRDVVSVLCTPTTNLGVLLACGMRRHDRVVDSSDGPGECC